MTKARDLADGANAFDVVSATELEYLNGVSSAIQTQIDGKQAVVSGVDSTEIGYLNGVTSAIQTQIDSKIGSASAINPTIVDAKGDLLVGSAADTVARLAVGTNNHVLTADSSATNGVKWAAPASSGFVGVKLSKSGSQSLTNNTGTKITWDTEDYDTDGFHSTSSNTSRITIPSGKAGKYRITATGSFADNATGQRYFAFYKNGTLILVFSRLGGYSSFDTAACGSIDVNLAESDYIELEAFQNSGGALIFGGTTFSDFSAQFLGA